MCRAFKVPRSTTLLNNLDRIGWKGAGVGQGATEPKPRKAVKLAKVKWDDDRVALIDWLLRRRNRRGRRPDGRDATPQFLEGLIDLKAGQHVSRGEQLGLIGIIRRATGPHLHLALSWRTARLDTGLFVPE